MSLRATEVIHAIESSIAASELQYQSIKVQSNLVSLIRSYIRCIYSELHTANENHLWLDKLRLALLKLQTSPVLLTTQLIDDYGLGDEDEVDRAATQFDATDKLPEGNRKRVESAADSVEGGMTIEMTELQS